MQVSRDKICSSEWQWSEWMLETRTLQFLEADKMWKTMREREMRDHSKALGIWDKKNDYCTEQLQVLQREVSLRTQFQAC